MTSKHKNEDYKLSAVEYYLIGDKSQLEVYEIFKCSPRSLIRWLFSKNLGFLEISLKYKQYGKIKRENINPVAYKIHKNMLNFYWMKLKRIKLLQ